MLSPRRTLIGLVACVVVVAGTGIGRANATATAPTVNTPGRQLPVEVRADFGNPVAWGDTYVWMYADLFNTPEPGSTTGAYLARNGVVVDGELMMSVLPETVSGSFYWLIDGVELADGSLMVSTLEVINRFDLPAPMLFEVIDADMWIVRQPDDPRSWRWATKIDDGPWGMDSVYFLDGADPLLVARNPYETETTLHQYDPADPTVWTDIDSQLPAGDGAFAPINGPDGWWGVSWHIAGFPDAWDDTAVLWHADDVRGPWQQVDTYGPDLETHDHQLNIVDGRVIWRSNNLDGSRRPEYQDVTMSLDERRA